MMTDQALVRNEQSQREISPWKQIRHHLQIGAAKNDAFSDLADRRRTLAAAPPVA